MARPGPATLPRGARLLPALALALAACGSPSASTDLPADAPIDAAPDVPGDVPADVPDTPSPWPAGVLPLAPEPDPVTAGGLPAETAPDRAVRPAADAFAPANTALAQGWRFRLDDADEGLAARWFDPAHDRSKWKPIAVPAAWDLSDPDLFDVQGAGWYAVELPARPAGAPAAILRFDGAFRETRAWINGADAGSDDLPYLPFAFDVTSLLRTDGPNLLVVRVDSRMGPSTLPCTIGFQGGLHGWLPWSGLTRPVHLDGSLGTAVTRVAVSADPATGAFRAEVRLRREAPPRAPIRVSARLLRGDVVVHAWDPFDLPPDHDGGLALDATVPDPNALRAAPGRFVAYRLEVTLAAPGGATDLAAWDVAFRTFQAKDGRFRADGADVFLHGMNRHEDHPLHGPVYDAAVSAADVDALRRLNVDFVRPAHYPNDVRTLRDLEAAGIRTAEEVPVYQWQEPHFTDPVLVDRALRAARRMVVRDATRPGIVMWSVANEIWTFVPQSLPFVQSMVDAVKGLDPTRPVMLASLMEVMLSFTELDVGQEPVDVIGINEYAGWYEGRTTGLGDLLDRAPARFPGKAFFVSEYGADALFGRRQHRPSAEEVVDAHSFSEDWQAWFHRQHLRAFAQRDWIRGVMPWVLADFRMQWRQTTGKPHPVDRTNLKGFLDAWRRPKVAFDVLAKAFSLPSGLAVPPEPACGDGRVDPGEACDGGAVPCESLGASWSAGGTAPCTPDCRGRDTSACAPLPGDPARFEVVKPALRDPARWDLARCNDGSPFAFRVRPSPTGSRNWVVSLRGGGFCEEQAVPCIRTEDLYATVPQADRDTLVPDDENGGIVDVAPAVNPDLYDANLVFAWYCTSDFWAGTRTAPVPTLMSPDPGWLFGGRNNVQAMLESLAAHYGLADHPQTRVLFGGTSSGAFGAAATADLVADLLPGAAADGRVKVLLDAGWLVHDWDEPDARVMLAEKGDAAIMRDAHAFLQARLNPSCEESRIRAGGDAGDCIFGRWFTGGLVDPPPAGLGLPVLVVQSLMDWTFAPYHNHPDDVPFAERYGARQWADVLLADPGPDAAPPVPLKASWFLAWQPFHDVTRKSDGWLKGEGDDTLPDVISRFWHDGPPERVVFDPRGATPAR